MTNPGVVNPARFRSEPSRLQVANWISALQGQPELSAVEVDRPSQTRGCHGQSRIVGIPPLPISSRPARRCGGCAADGDGAEHSVPRPFRTVDIIYSNTGELRLNNLSALCDEGLVVTIVTDKSSRIEAVLGFHDGETLVYDIAPQDLRQSRECSADGAATGEGSVVVLLEAQVTAA